MKWQNIYGHDFLTWNNVWFIPYAGGLWSEEASRLIVELTQFRTLQAQIAGYTDNGIPEIYLYSFLGPNVSIIYFHY